MVGSYRIYFRSRGGAILGRDDFDAKDDDTAMNIAESLCRACSDMSDSFELWQSTRRVDSHVDGARLNVNAEALNAQTQELVVIVEERLLQSRWAIARSIELLKRTRPAGGNP